jgi:hypothetical protein
VCHHDADEIVLKGETMSMSTHVVGFRPADDDWKKMKEVRKACIRAGVEVPGSVERFFGDQDPDTDEGVEVSIEGALKEYTSDACQGFDVDISKLPKGLKIIRFYNAY